VEATMYLRTTKRKNKGGSVIDYYQLAYNERHPEQRLLMVFSLVAHNFAQCLLSKKIKTYFYWIS
jgi:hypothetical protein